MSNLTLWDEIMKTRNDIQLEFEGISFKGKVCKDASEKALMRVLANVLSRACNPKMERINISINEVITPILIKQTNVAVGGYIDTDSNFRFADCDGKYIFNEIKEALIKCGVEFVREEYDPRLNWWFLAIDLPKE